MTFIVPFEGEFCGEMRTIYSVNNDNPNRWGSNTTTSEKCPHCGERYFYRVYDPRNEYEEDGYCTAIYDCKCPSCRKEFDLKIEDEIEE